MSNLIREDMKMEEKNAFIEVLEKIGEKRERIGALEQKIHYFCQVREPEAAYKMSFRLEDTAEKLVLLARVLPAYTGSPAAAWEVEKIMKENIPVEIGFTEEGWFSLRIPMLLPKKRAGSTKYLTDFLYPAMRGFFAEKEPVRYRDCVLIFRHVYDRKRPERRKRDHDNIETKTVTDVVALYVMADDSPDVCSNYECSAVGDVERTEVYVVPAKDFTTWFLKKDTMPEEGVKLYDSLAQNEKNDM